MRWGRQFDAPCVYLAMRSPIKSKSFRACARVTFLCLPKEKSPKEKAALRRARRCAPGPQASRGFSKGHPWPIEKRTTSCRAPCGPDPQVLPLRRAIEQRHFGKKSHRFASNILATPPVLFEKGTEAPAAAKSARSIKSIARRLSSPHWSRPSEQSNQGPLDFPLLSNLTLTLTSTALRSGGSRGQGPQGARQEAARFSKGHGWPFEKPPRGTRTRRNAPGATQGCAFFCLLFFAQAKKSTVARQRESIAFK